MRCWFSGLIVPVLSMSVFASLAAADAGNAGKSDGSGDRSHKAKTRSESDTLGDQLASPGNAEGVGSLHPCGAGIAIEDARP